MKLNEVSKSGYLAYVVPEQVRGELATRFPPKNPEFIGHHITHVFGWPATKPAPQGMSTIKVIGHAEADGLEAFVVTVDGQALRPDGKRYHLTWSLDRAKGRKPVDSNRVVADGGHTPVQPITFTASLEVLN